MNNIKKCVICQNTFSQSDHYVKCSKCCKNIRYDLDDLIIVHFQINNEKDDDYQIIEISAIYYKNYLKNYVSEFNQYCIPYLLISPEVSKKSNLTNDENKLFYKNNEIIDIKNEEEVLKNFINWLPKNRFVLTSYNTYFHIDVLSKQLDKYHLWIDTNHRWFCSYTLIKNIKKLHLGFDEALKHYNIDFDKEKEFNIKRKGKYLYIILNKIFN